MTNSVLKICEQMVRVDRLIKSSRDAKVRAVLREEYKALGKRLDALGDALSMEEKVNRKMRDLADHLKGKLT